MKVSIVICTAGRAESLRATLSVLRGVSAEVTDAEIVVVDNDPQGSSLAIIEEASSMDPRVMALHEPRRGKSRALNLAVSAASGDVVLLTDDDVIVPAGWVETMCRPIIEGEADAVAGGVRVAPSLRRPWLTPDHAMWLASTEHSGRPEWHPLIGANAAVHRRVIEAVGGFDPEVGPGALGHAEDTLFSLQARRAGYRIVTRFEVEVEHHFDAARLGPEWFLQQARRRGDFAAYVMHHFECIPARRVAVSVLKQQVRRLAVLATEVLGRENGRLPSMRRLEAEEALAMRRRLVAFSGETPRYQGRSVKKVHGELPLLEQTPRGVAGQPVAREIRA